MMFLWIIVLIGVVLWISGAFGNRSGAFNFSGDKTNALDILKARYARGEIDKAEFESRRNDLVS